MRTKQLHIVKIAMVLALFLAGNVVFAQTANRVMPPADKAKEKKVEITNPTADFNPDAVNTVAATDAVGDIVFDLDIETITGDNRLLGAEFDGTSLWATGRGHSDIGDLYQIYEIDPAGTLLNTYPQNTTSAWGMRDMCYVESEDMLYAGDDNGFYSIDPADGTVTTIFSGTGSMGVIRALAYDGTYFWTKSFGGDLYKFDVTGTVIDSYTMAESAYGMAYDEYEGFLYLFATPTTFYQIDPATGSLTGTNYAITPPNGGIIGGAFFDFGNLVPGLATLGCMTQGEPDVIYAMELRTAADPSAPAGAQNLMVTAGAMGALEATVEWDNPSLDVAGNTLTELTQVTLAVDGEVEWTNASPTIGGAESVTIDNTVITTAGYHTFTVLGTNTSGDGIPVEVSAYIGEDVPPAVENFTLTDNAGDAELTWDNPTGDVGPNGGYWDGTIDGYEITRSDGTTFSITGTQTSYTDNTITDPGYYDYTIYPYNGVGNGPETTSNGMTFGALLWSDMSDFSAWTVGGDSPNWTQEASANAGGEAPEAQFGWSPSFTGDSWLLSPEINTTGMSIVSFEFSHYVDDYNAGDYSLNVWTTSDGGTTWNEAWSVEPEGDIGPQVESMFIANSDVGSDVMQVAFVFSGVSFDINYWYVDDVHMVEAADMHDVGVMSIDMSSTVMSGDVTPTATVKNFGTFEETFDVTATIDDYTSTQSVTLAVGESAQVEFDTWAATVGTYTMEVATELSGDENPDNDDMTFDFEVIEMGDMVFAFMAYDPSGAIPEGPITFALNTPDMLISLGANTAANFIPAGTWVNNGTDETWYVANYDDGGNGVLYTVDPSTGTMTAVGSGLAISPSGLAYDGVEDVLYAADITNLYTVDMTAGTTTWVGPMGNAGGVMIDIASDENGNFYGYDIGDDNFYTIDKTTAMATVVGNIGFDASYAQGMEYDLDNATMYMAAYNAATAGELRSVDMTTGGTTYLGDFAGGSEVCALSIPNDGGYSGGTPDTYVLTMNVDMNFVDPEDFDPESDVIYVSGDMVEWAEPGTATEAEMTDDDGDMIYTVSFEVEAGTYTYKYFMNAGWDGGEWPGDPNREVEVVDADVTVNDFWNNQNVVADIEAGNISLYPNPTNGEVNITNVANANITVFNLLGEVVYTVNNAAATQTVDLSELARGTYAVMIEKDGRTYVTKINIMR